MADKGPLNDTEIAYLYAVCRADSETAYQYIRRLHHHGVIPDPPYVDEMPVAVHERLQLEQGIRSGSQGDARGGS